MLGAYFYTEDLMLFDLDLCRLIVLANLMAK